MNRPIGSKKPEWKRNTKKLMRARPLGSKKNYRLQKHIFTYLSNVEGHEASTREIITYLKNRRVSNPYGDKYARPAKSIVPSMQSAAGVLQRSRLFEVSYKQKKNGVGMTVWRLKDGATLESIG